MGNSHRPPALSPHPSRLIRDREDVHEILMISTPSYETNNNIVIHLKSRTRLPNTCDHRSNGRCSALSV